MATHDVERFSTGAHSVHGLTMDIDIDGSVTLVHQHPRNDDGEHVFVLRHAYIVALLDFFATPEGHRIAEHARREHGAVMAVTLGQILKLAKDADIACNLVSIAELPALIRRLSDTSRT